MTLHGEPVPVDRVAEERRSYATVNALRRIHQGRFRERVLRAYRECCAVCRLRHRELLDATHILPDKHPLGEPTISNGLSLCKIHHAAYDRNILGIDPDLRIEIRPDVLRENPDFLAERYAQFKRAS